MRGDSGCEFGPYSMDNKETKNKLKYMGKPQTNSNPLEAEIVAAFKRSAILSRTPPQTSAIISNTPVTTKPTESSSVSMAASQRREDKAAADEITIFDGMSGTPASHHGKEQRQNTQKAMDGQQKSAALPTDNNSVSKTSLLSELIERLGKEIDSLLQYVEPRRNVHGDIRRMCSIIKCAHTEVTMQLKNEERLEKEIGTPVQSRTKTTAVEGNSITLPAKRMRTKTSPKEATQGAAKSPDPKKRRPISPQKLVLSEDTEKWHKVQRTNKPPKPKKASNALRPRSDAIIIQKKAEATTYADMLRAVKSSVELRDFSERVKTMRPTQKGGLLIELKRSKDSDSIKYQTAFEKALEGVATVNIKTQIVTLQCKGLIAGLNTSEELLDAIAEQAKVRKPDKTAIKSFRTTLGGTQSAYIALCAEDAKKVLDLGSLKVGWVRSRVTEVISPKRCFKCWAYDHVAVACKGPDRMKLCRRCGKEGHQAASCKNAEKCVLCDGAHAAGSAKCPHHQEAARKMKV